MVHKIRILGLAVSALLLPAVALAQAPPPTKTPVAPKVEQLDPDACAHSDTQTTVGKGGEADAQRQDGKGNLSDKLARSGGVICPPEHVNSEIKQPTPPGGSMPVIPPPGSPGGNPRFSRSNGRASRSHRSLAAPRAARRWRSRLRRRSRVAQDDAPERLDGGRFTAVFFPATNGSRARCSTGAVRNDTFPGLPRPRQHVLIAIAPDARRFREWVGPGAPEWGAAIAFPESRRIVMQGRSAGADAGDPREVLRHELAHLALHEYLGDLPPRWFDEGYASYAAREWTREDALAANLALALRGTPTLDELDGEFDGGRDDGAEGVRARLPRGGRAGVARHGARAVAVLRDVEERARSMDARCARRTA